MPFETPTRDELILRNEAELTLSLGTPVLQGSVDAVLARIQALGAFGLHGRLEYLSRQLFADSAEVEFLERLASIWGVSRKPAVAASGLVAFAGQDQATVPAGTQVQAPTGAVYTTTEALTLVQGIDDQDGKGSVNVLAAEAGLDGNLPGGTALSLTQTVTGVATAATGVAGLLGGLETESDEDLRVRLLTRIQQPPKGGAESDYVLWALEVPGATRAWAFAHWMGVGTVGVTFAADDAPGGPIPDQALVDEVDTLIQSRRPVTAQASVFAPTAVPVTFQVSVSPDTAQVRAAVELALEDLLAREAVPGQTLPLSKVSEAISTAPGESGHTLLAPSADLEPAAGELLTFGGVTWV